MPKIAAIDVGSNAIRLVVGDAESHDGIKVLKNLREPVRLGQDVFARRTISDEITDRAVEAFSKFRTILDSYGVKETRAVATCAVREALNRDIFIDRISQETGIRISPIAPEEEARLIHLAVSKSINLKNKVSMLVDIGGGSIEITLVSDGKIIATESLNMGAVRLLQMLQSKKFGEKRFNRMVKEYANAAKKMLEKRLGGQKIDMCVGTGGNVEAIGELQKQLCDKNHSDSIELSELDVMIKKLQVMSFEDRIELLRLRPDRADVILPAAIVLQMIMKQAHVDRIMIPNVGLKDGLLRDIALELFGKKKAIFRDQVISSSMNVGKKYFFDEQHGLTVAQHAMRLFDETRHIHHLDEEAKMLLEVAGILHDIGRFINVNSHHKHSQYLISATPIVGLTEGQRSVVAHIARYHRKTFPTQKHDSFSRLAPKDRVTVTKLSAILRIADSLDVEHGAKIKSFDLDLKKKKMVITLTGEGDLLLVKWALLRKCDLFEEVFGVKVSIGD